MANGTTKAGIFILSIDVATPAERTNAKTAAMLEGACGRLLSQLKGAEISATWAVDEPAHWSFAPRLQASSVKQEVAVLASAEWIGSAAGRNTFAQELGRRVLAARAAGLPVTTIVPYESAIDDHLDLLIKHEVTAVRGIVDHDARATRPAQPHPLHYGLWEFPGSLTLPGRSRWFPGGGGGWKASRRIKRTAQLGEIFHLVLDLGTWAEMGAAAEQVVVRLLHQVATLKHAGEIEVLTLAEAAQRLTPNRQGASTRSILRAAG